MAVRSHADKSQAELAAANAQTSRVRELQQSMARLTEDNAALQQQMKSSSGAGSDNVQMVELETSLAAARERIAELESAAGLSANIFRELSALRAENARLETWRKPNTAELRNQVAGLQHENTTKCGTLAAGSGHDGRDRGVQLDGINGIEELRVPVSPPTSGRASSQRRWDGTASIRFCPANL